MSARQVSIAKALIKRRSDGAYLVLRRSAWEDRPELAHKPDIPGGTVEPGESMLQACSREVFEEVGLTVDVDDLRLLHTQTIYYEPDDVSINRALFYTEVDDTPVKISWEHDGYRWLSYDELEEFGLSAQWLDPIRYAKKHSLID